MIKTVTLHETNRVGTTAAKYGATLIRHANLDGVNEISPLITRLHWRRRELGLG